MTSLLNGNEQKNFGRLEQKETVTGSQFDLIDVLDFSQIFCTPDRSKAKETLKKHARHINFVHSMYKKYGERYRNDYIKILLRYSTDDI